VRPVAFSSAPFRAGYQNISRPLQTGALKYMGDLAADGRLPPGFAGQAETTMNNVDARLAIARHDQGAPHQAYLTTLRDLPMRRRLVSP
jgi:hypothetical protein